MNYYPSVQPSAYSHAAPVQVVPSVPNGMGVPMPNGMAPGVPMGYNGGYVYSAPYNPYSVGNFFRRFFGLAPGNVRYRSDRGTWGFMGYSRRARYFNAYGVEVNRRGEPIFRAN